MAILFAEAIYLRLMELRRLKCADVIVPGDVRLAHEQLGLAAFFLHSPKIGKRKPQIRVFNDTFVIAMLQIFRDDHVMQLIAQKGNEATDILQQTIFPHIS